MTNRHIETIEITRSLSGAKPKPPVKFLKSNQNGHGYHNLDRNLTKLYKDLKTPPRLHKQKMKTPLEIYQTNKEAIGKFNTTSEPTMISTPRLQKHTKLNTENFRFKRKRFCTHLARSQSKTEKK